MSAGFNSFHGFDTGGAPPPGFGPAQPPGYGFAGYPAQAAYGFPAAQGFAPAVAPVAAPYSAYPGMANPSYSAYPGYGGIPNPSIAPLDPSFPGTSFRNPTGGVGMPPGYNYLYSQENCTIHALKNLEGNTPPWQQTVLPIEGKNHVKVFVPVTTTITELLSGLGARNEDKKKNVIHEVVERGNGLWSKGLTITGDDKDKVKKMIKDYGWDKKRTGFPGDRPVVWVYITKD